MENDEYIEFYFKGLLNDEDLQSFESKLNSDPEFKKEVELHRAVIHGVKEFFQEKTLNHFADLEKQAALSTPDKRVKVISLSYKILAFAASVVLILWIWNPFYSVNGEELFATYYTSYLNYDENVEDSLNRSDNYKKAFFAYEQKKYKDACSLFELTGKVYQARTPEDIDNEAVIEFYWGMSLLELDKLQDALLHLQKSVNADKHRYSDNANWYMALILIRLGNYDEARSALLPLIDNNSSYKEKAEKIIGLL
jgi:tetratricopeptide (TPR) repeat protein